MSESHSSLSVGLEPPHSSSALDNTSPSGSSSSTKRQRPNSGKRNSRNTNKKQTQPQTQASSSSSPLPSSSMNTNRNNTNQDSPHRSHPSSSSSPSSTKKTHNQKEKEPEKPVVGMNRRQKRFNAGLTVGNDDPIANRGGTANDDDNDTTKQSFGTSSTKSPSPHPPPTTTGRRRKQRVDQNVPPPADDLTSKLIHSLRTPPFPDCLICFNPIRPEQPVWSCNPSMKIIGSRPENGSDEPSSSSAPQYCWTVIHLKCIKPWAWKSVKDYEEALRNRGEEGWKGKGEWRCPGCQGRRKDVVQGYYCFCGSIMDPSPPRLATPHSCASPCSRPRLKCAHPCPLSCHPGPCPPCKISVSVRCSCPKGVSGQVKCADLTRDIGTTTSTNSGATVHQQGEGLKVSVLPDGSPSVSCGSICGKPRTCGDPEHTCPKVCHEGPCDPCVVPAVETCTCSKEARIVECGSRQPLSFDDDAVDVPQVDDVHLPRVAGTWKCARPCEFSFSCSRHSCKEICHAHPSNATRCPFDPKVVKTCPCGKSTIATGDGDDDVSSIAHPATFPARKSCEDVVPTCMQPCLKLLPICGHTCAKKCHHGPCTPCQETVVRPCRCGSKIFQVPCFEVYDANGEEKTMLCDKPCTALRSCGRHRCNRPCCPLASLAAVQFKKGKGRQNQQLRLEGDDEAGVHLCDLVCNKVLACGRHRCSERDHKGQCPPCLQSSWDELVCACGKTTMYPPIPCGVTTPDCHEKCHRGPLNPNCGLHPLVDHKCHPDSEDCPPCAFLVSRRCACNKTLMNNVRCSMEKERIGCGKVCGKVMESCGVHRCERVCHPPSKEEADRLGIEGGVEGGGCGECKAVCGKSRKSCLPLVHPCTQPCHAPSACPEDVPCEAIVTLTCACGRIKRGVPCGRTNFTPLQENDGSNPQANNGNKIKCTSECAIAKRNARLADALGIKPSSSGSGGSSGDVVYTEDLKSYARMNPRLLSLVEMTFADFVNGKVEKKVLPHMPPDRRKFVCDMAGIYRMSYHLVDAEPHRSVQIIRRIDTRIPHPLLSRTIASSASTTPTSSSTTTLGKLTDLRSSASSSGSNAPSWRSIGGGGGGGTGSTSRPSGGDHKAGVLNPNPTTSSSLSAPEPRSTPSGVIPPSSIAGAVTPPTPRSVTPVATTSNKVQSSAPDEPVPDNWEDDE